jgi:prophage antirepressor-like protein
MKMSEMMPFAFEYDGKKYPIRRLEEDGEMVWNASDVCDALGYVNSSDAISRHVDKDDIVKRYTIDSSGRKQRGNYVTESGLYALILGSKLEQAKAFKRWVTKEVLPAIRKTGHYNFAQQKIELLLAPHIQPWVKLFPPEFWTNLDRLYGIKRIDVSKHPMFYAGCVQFVYETFDQDVHDEMRSRVPTPTRSGPKQHQTLNEAGRMAMERHIARHIGLQDASGDSEQWKELARRIFSKQLQLPDSRQTTIGQGERILEVQNVRDF